jgi:tetratricopeptide (TPR) repeat protein
MSLERGVRRTGGYAMRVLFRIFVLGLTAILLLDCSSSPEAMLAKHTKRGDRYYAERKFPEAVIEYRNAVKAVPKDANAHWKLAKAALATKDIRTAYWELRKVVELDPGNYEALGRLGEICVLAGRTKEARSAADKLIASRPNDPEGYILRSGVMVRSGKVDDAIDYLKKAAELDPARVTIQLTLGNLYFMKHDARAARTWYDKALATDPNDVDVHVTRGNYFFASGDGKDGEKEYRTAIRLSKAPEDLRIQLAEHYLFQARVEEGERELHTLIAEKNSQKARKMLAEIKLDMGKPSEATPIIDAILKENDKDLDGKYLKGRVALMEKRFNDAKVLFNSVLKQDVNMAGARLYDGLTEIQLGQIELGRREIRQAVALAPGDARAQLILGRISLRAHDPVGAEKAATAILRRNPSNVRAALLLADSFLSRQEWGRAEQICRSLIRQMPKKAAGYREMGILRKLQGKPAEAARYFAQALERSPEDPGILDEYVFSLAASKKTATAKKLLEDRLARDAGNARIWEIAGRFYVATGDSAAAKEAFLKAVGIAPDSTAPYYQLGMLYASQKKFRESESRLRKVVEQNHRDIGAGVLLGMVINSQGRIHEANEEYRRVLALSPKNAIAANNLASNLADGDGNLDEALTYAQTAREAAPDDPAIGDTLGWVLFKKGLYDQAAPLIEEAARAARGKDASIRYHYGMLLVKKGRKKEAAAELKAALAKDPRFPGADEARKVLGGL